MAKKAKEQVGFKSDVLSLQKGSLRLSDAGFSDVRISDWRMSPKGSVTCSVYGKATLNVAPRVRYRFSCTGSITFIGSASLSDEKKEELMSTVVDLSKGFDNIPSSLPKVRNSGNVGFGFYGKGIVDGRMVQVSIHVTANHSRNWPDQRPASRALKGTEETAS